LDVATSGLILLTDDTALADRLMRPASGVEKEYEVEIDREVLPEFLEKLAAGVDIGGYVTKNAQLSKIGSKSFAIVVTEGKNRQIRRMCEALGATVKRLRRVRIGGVRLGKLPKGGWRTLTDEELASLRP
jgi:23S rRNA pseudouridine2604 synthase